MSDERRPVSHYCQGGIECIDALRSALGQERFEGFLAGNAIKYLWRYRHKNGVDDLYKANTYLTWLIAEVVIADTAPSGKLTEGPKP